MTPSTTLLDWFDRSGRPLAFRTTSDPWAVLVSEVMLQQTQVSRVEPAWQAWMRRFPTPAASAEASPADALRAWAGLGYNRRALALRRTAVTIVEEHGGIVPRDVATLVMLPGIGAYTARAVAAIAFGQPVAAVDTNLRRVVGRMVTGSGPSMAAPVLQATADSLIDGTRPAAWTHAMMDVGATICRPRVPDCGRCPLRDGCRFAAEMAEPAEPAGPLRAAEATSRILSSGAGHAATARSAPFHSTSRWLRGRIIDRLRAAPDGSWLHLTGAIGDHPPSRVAEAVSALQGEGMLERRHDGALRLPLGRS